MILEIRLRTAVVYQGKSLDKIQRIVFLNLPARRSRGYFDYFQANIPADNIVFVDALFGGLDIVARLKWSSENGEQFVVQEVKSLIQGNKPDEATITRVVPFFEIDSFETQENFIIVICRQQYDMNEGAHQRSFSEFLKRSGIQKALRFAGTVERFDVIIEGIPLPYYLKEDIDRARAGEVIILEFSVNTLDDARRIVMDTLQQFPGIEATRTFVGVNYGELKEEKPSKAKTILAVLRPWANPLLILWRLITWWR